MTESRRCVRCDHGMKRVEFESVEIDRCGHCGGMWLDEGEIDALWDSQGEKAADEGQMEEAIAKLLDAPVVDANAGRDQATQSACPSCAGKLTLVTFAETKIEQCSGCRGIFLDRGELQKAMALLDTPGGTTIMALARSVTASGTIG